MKVIFNHRVKYNGEWRIANKEFDINKEDLNDLVKEGAIVVSKDDIVESLKDEEIKEASIPVEEVKEEIVPKKETKKKSTSKKRG